MKAPATGRPPAATAGAAPSGPTLRCPNCRMRFTTTHPSFPRCPRCTKPVITCRNCRWFEKNFFECTNPRLLRGAANLGDNQGRLPIQDPDVLVTCPEHDSLLLVRSPSERNRLLASLVTVASFSGAGALILLLAFSLWAKAPKVNAPPKMSLNMRAPTEVDPNSVFAVEFFIRNLEPRESPDVWLRFQQGLFDQVELMEVQPPYYDMVVRGGVMSSQGRYFRFARVPGNSETVIRFSLRCKDIGHFRSLVRLEVPGATQGQKYLDFDCS